MAGVGGAAVSGRHIGWRAGTPAPPSYFHIKSQSIGDFGSRRLQPALEQVENLCYQPQMNFAIASMVMINKAERLL
jgi:hypothetical protein